MFREATEKRIINIARYYHYKIVQVLGTDNDVRSNIRKGLNITTAANYRLEHSTKLSNTSTKGTPQKGRGTNVASAKRSSSQTDALLSPRKRSCPSSPTKADRSILPNRVHRRVVLRDYKMSIYKTSSRAALLTALEGCIVGHESLREVGFLYRDISVNNLMINKDNNNPSATLTIAQYQQASSKC